MFVCDDLLFVYVSGYLCYIDVCDDFWFIFVLFILFDDYLLLSCIRLCVIFCHGFTNTRKFLVFCF